MSKDRPRNPVDDYRSRPICRPYRPPGPPPLWRDAALALVAGLAAAQALPNTHAWWLLPIALSALLVLLHGQLRWHESRRSRALISAALLYAFGLGWEGWGLRWVAEAFFVEADRFGAIAPFAVSALAAAAAAFMAAAGAIYGLLWRDDAFQAARLALLLVLFEMMRESPLVLGGFPWNPFAHVLSPATFLPLMQAASLVGVWGLSALVAFWAALPGQVWLCWREGNMHAALAIAGAGLSLLAMLWGYGLWRLSTPVQQANVQIAIVQPDIDQKEKWKPENREHNFNLLLELTREAVRKARAGQGNADKPLFIVWPESAVPFLLADSPVGLKMIGNVLPENAWLFTGALRAAPKEMRRPDGPRLFNSILGIDANGDVRFVYDKRRLVPFGEYLPLDWLLRPLGIRAVAEMPRGFFFGRNPGPHRVDGLPTFEAFVCYEIVFDDPPPRADETRWLLNVTNDAWFGTSSGPYQHFMAARYRAIERGVPLVRAANTGISAIVDGNGRIVRELPLLRRGIIIAPLPANHSQTFYARMDRWQIVLAILILLVLMGLQRTRCGSVKRV